MPREARAVKVGTRGSRLALEQADLVGARLTASNPALKVERCIIKTVGDKILDTPLSQIGDKGLFTKELDLALLRGEIDLAVHSLKDLPTMIPDELTIGAIVEREDPSDALISASGENLDALPRGATVGTSSLRRRSQLLALRRDLAVVNLRGNVPSRLEKLERGQVDAIVLARAGLVRLGLGAKITEVIGPDRMLSAVGQGAIAVVIRRNDMQAAELTSTMDHRPSRLAVWAERAFLRRLEGGCQVPIGALGRFDGDQLRLEGLVADLDGTKVIRSREEGSATNEAQAAMLGERLAQTLINLGAGTILERIFAEARPFPRPSPSGGESAD